MQNRNPTTSPGMNQTHFFFIKVIDASNGLSLLKDLILYQRPLKIIKMLIVCGKDGVFNLNFTLSAVYYGLPFYQTL
jgi:hypothetical protein